MLILIVIHTYMYINIIMKTFKIVRDKGTALQTCAATLKLHLCLVYKLFNTFYSVITSIGPPQ